MLLSFDQSINTVFIYKYKKSNKFFGQRWLKINFNNIWKFNWIALISKNSVVFLFMDALNNFLPGRLVSHLEDSLLKAVELVNEHWYTYFKIACVLRKRNERKNALFEFVFELHVLVNVQLAHFLIIKKEKAKFQLTSPR